MRFPSAAILGFLSLGVSVPAHAASIFVERATGSSASGTDLTTATELIQASVAESSGNTLADDKRSAELVLRPKLIRLGESYILSLTKLENGKAVFSSQLKAQYVDELDTVARRLTHAVLEDETPAADPEMDGGGDHETATSAERRPARKSTYLGLGGVGLANLQASGIGYSIGGAYAWDADHALVKLMAEGSFSGHAMFASGSLGGNYFLSMKDAAPYLAADFGLGVAKIDGGSLTSGATQAGFVGGLGAGVQFLRTSSVNLDLGFRAGYLLRTNALGNPATYSLRLGLFF